MSSTRAAWYPRSANTSTPASSSLRIVRGPAPASSRPWPGCRAAPCSAPAAGSFADRGFERGTCARLAVRPVSRHACHRTRGRRGYAPPAPRSSQEEDRTPMAGVDDRAARGPCRWAPRHRRWCSRTSPARTMFVRYAGASGDFNPMHHDDTIATQVGNPSVFGHGMLTAGLDGARRQGLVRSRGDPHATRCASRSRSGRASRSRAPRPSPRSTTAATSLVDVECKVANQDGEVKLTGTASAAVPKA